MKKTIIGAWVALALTVSITSCENINQELVLKIEQNKTDLIKVDSILKEQEKLLAGVVTTDSSAILKTDSLQVTNLKKCKETKENVELLISQSDEILQKLSKNEMSNLEAEAKQKEISISFSDLFPEIESIKNYVAELNTKLEIEKSNNIDSTKN